MSSYLFVLAGCKGVGAEPALPSVKYSGQTLPFVKSTPVVIPTGTLIRVRLQQDISNTTAVAGDPFQAVLDTPVIVDGQTVAVSGCSVGGTVIAARRSRSLHEGGYLRISLSSVSINGNKVPLQTHSLLLQSQVAQPSSHAGSGGRAKSAKDQPAGTQSEVKFTAQSQLVFRLTQPVTVN
jgi:hypothetical protein